MNQNRLSYLTKKLKEGTATEEEILELETFYNQFEKKQGYTGYLDTAQKNAYKELIFNRIYTEIHQDRKNVIFMSRKRLITRLSIAASILLFIGIAFYTYDTKNDTVPTEKANVVAKHADLNKSKAVLTLANGQKIILTDAEIGVLSNENGIFISKTADGELVYINNNQALQQESINQIDIPKGENYQIKLPDGTKVWLNAASSLRYPSAFIGKERQVELSGEAYFEVAKNKDKPFKVKTSNQTIEVLGTHFNVNSYPDENWTRTTLLEGSVKVNRKEKSIILKPGEQALTATQNTNIQTSVVDTEEVLAWKSGYFLFENADIKYIMRHLARWYDIEIEYSEEITKQKFGGAFQQSASLEELLGFLKSYGDVNFKVQGRKVIVMK